MVCLVSLDGFTCVIKECVKDIQKIIHVTKLEYHMKFT